MLPGPASTSCGIVLGGRYRLQEVLGQGGMATVYRAHDQLLDRDVAVKLFPPTPDPEEELRHRAEMTVLAHLSHPGLVTLHDAGTSDAGAPLPQTFLVMELVPGPTLADLLVTGPLSAAHTARVGGQLAEALAVVHRAGVVHRDVKPANVLLVDRAAAVEERPEAALTTGPVVKLADFGIARLAGGARLTMTGTTLGTATYLSPEQAAGEEIGPPTDVYALGLVLLECLTGERAFTGTVMEVAVARLNASPPIPQELGEQWNSLLRAMTERDPAHRATMADAAAELARLATAPPGAGSTGRFPGATAVPETADGGVPRPVHAASTAPDIVHTRPLSTGDVVAVAVARGDRFRAEHGAARGDAPAGRGPVAPTGVAPTGVGRTAPVRTTPGRTGPGHTPALRTLRDSAVGATHGPAPAALGRALVGAFAAVTVIVGLGIGVHAVEAAQPVPPAYPAVDGPLGAALDDLARSVEP